MLWFRKNIIYVRCEYFVGIYNEQLIVELFSDVALFLSIYLFVF